MKSIDSYEQFLNETVEAWSSSQRIAFSAAMAERWLPSYEAFSKKEKWGDPAALRRGLDAVWMHVQGRSLAPTDRTRYGNQIQDCTPHMDDSDDPAALAACVIVREALECCGTTENARYAVSAALSGFEAVAPEWAEDPDAHPKLWKTLLVRKELQNQKKLIERIEALGNFDDKAIKKLRSTMAGSQLVGEIESEPKKPSGPPALTNQEAFETYRRFLTSHLKRPAWVPPDATPYMIAMSIFSEWGVRYLHRLRTINGKNGRLADTVAQEALVAKNRARDANTAVPEWPTDMLRVMGMCLANLHVEYDAKALDQPHGYGPSVRRLWFDAKANGWSDTDAWDRVVAWSRHQPAAWAIEDKRKKRGLTYSVPALGEHLARELTWTASGDPDAPWALENWKVRLNDFPDDVMYTLEIDGLAVGSFHDWPETWKRGPRG